MTVENAIIDPTERSMPPIKMTSSHAGRHQTDDRYLAQHVGEVAVGQKNILARGGDGRSSGADQEQQHQAPIELGA